MQTPRDQDYESEVHRFWCADLPRPPVLVDPQPHLQVAADAGDPEGYAHDPEQLHCARVVVLFQRVLALLPGM